MFQTDSQHVLMVSGTGHAGMEACISNLVEPGDKVVIGNNGIWGARVCDMAARFRGQPPSTFPCEIVVQHASALAGCWCVCLHDQLPRDIQPGNMESSWCAPSA